MEKDFVSFVKKFKKCHQCQQYINLIHTPTHELRPQVTPWPFSLWGLDIIGKIFPPSQGHSFIITTTNYFMKWRKQVPFDP